MSGRAMRRYLESLGICAQKIVHRKDTDYYVADFFVPEMSDAVESSRIWAGRLCALLPDVMIVTTHDTVASWRPGHPVIYATVVFRLPEEEAA